MGSLTIRMSAELERRLREEAARRGQAVGDYARTVLEESVAALDGADGSNWDRLPRRSPEQAVALAVAQGAPLAAHVADLKGDFWPEEETCDEFIETIRRWRREGGYA